MSTNGFDLGDVLRGRALVIASNRGPVAFEKDESGELRSRRGAGGLVTALTQIMRQASGIWVASAMTSGDREAVKLQGDEHLDVEFDGDSLRLRYLTFSKDQFDRYYNRISNSVFWFMQHGLWNLPLQPRIDQQTMQSWESYQQVNQRFADALAEEIHVRGTAGVSPVMLHDYHLMLVAGYLRARVPDAFCYHFTHSPWTHPDGMRILPASITRRLLEGMLANDLLGFQSTRWARNFIACCEEILGAKVDYGEGLVFFEGRETVVRHYPISIDVDAARESASSQEAEAHARSVLRAIGDRKMILRVDRMELSKNVVRGFRAYAEFLRTYPEWNEKVVHVALLYPSRRALPEYRAYEAEVLALHDDINAEFGTDDWQPIYLINQDDYLRALACLRSYDVLVVNPIADGMNLVAKEGPAVNERGGVLILSQNAGAWFELAHGALTVNPYDISELAHAMNVALTMDSEERRSRAGLLAQVIEHNNPTKWVWHQLRDIRRLHSR